DRLGGRRLLLGGRSGVLAGSRPRGIGPGLSGRETLRRGLAVPRPPVAVPVSAQPLLLRVVIPSCCPVAPREPPPTAVPRKSYFPRETTRRPPRRHEQYYPSGCRRLPVTGCRRARATCCSARAMAASSPTTTRRSVAR